MTRTEWINFSLELCQKHAIEVTPQIREALGRVYGDLDGLVTQGLSWELAVEIYPDALARSNRGDPSAALQTAEEASETLASLDGLEGDEVERDREELRQLIDDCLTNARDIAAVPLTQRKR